MRGIVRTTRKGSRGFTGHEHIDEFGIINMNGRVYCPLTAQFFSPDPFVQAPHKWLNYNRYSYAWNNPLTFTDPTGERNHADNLTPDKRMHSVRGRIDIAGLEPGSAWNKRHFPAPWQRTNNHAGFPSFVFSGSDLSGSSSFSASGHNNQQSFMMGAGNFQQIVGNDNFRWIVEHGGEDWTFIEDLTILLPEVSISRHRVPARAQSGGNFASGAHDWGSFGVGAWSTLNSANNMFGTLIYAFEPSRESAKRLIQIRKTGTRLGVVGAGFIVADIAMSGEVGISHGINAGVTAAALFGGPAGAGVAATWFFIDYGTMGINLMLGRGPIGMGDMIDNAVGTLRIY